ncbi:hypothetical protein [Chitinibacter tainanensis]|uniref:hypothetical protein n=1 Tax=Chitinibacter tainanensis TaxID=230667 RepID=UPI0023552504|nr:hypothetical protein [Chitinibacter tainanensis]
MAIHDSDAYAQIFNDSKLDKRIENYMLARFTKENPLLAQHIPPHNNSRSNIIFYINLYPHLLDTFKKYKSIATINNEKIDWIKDEKRQLYWLINSISKLYPESTHDLGNISLKEKAILSIDLINTTIDQKNRLVSYLKTEWETKLRREHFFEWLKTDDPKSKLEIARAEIEKLIPQHNTAKPFSSTTTLEDLLITIDSTNPSPSEIEKKYWIEGLKKKFNQKKYRKNLKDKKQYNFILSKKVIDTLDGLCEKYELSRAEIIELLVKMETISPTHLPNRIRYVQLMTEHIEQLKP